MVIKRIFNKRGQTLVETALVLPLLLLILMGIVEFGRVFNSYLIITNASREGARYAALSSTDTQIEQAVYNLSATLNNTRLFIDISPSASNRRSGESVTVKVDYDIDIIAPFINTIIPDPLRISSQTTMRIE